MHRDLYRKVLGQKNIIPSTSAAMRASLFAVSYHKILGMQKL